MSRPRVLLAGAGGRLGSVILRDLSESWDITAAFGPGCENGLGCDLLSPGDRRKLLGMEFDAAVNAAALSSPLECAERPAECLALNALWPLVLARECRLRSVPMVHFSSDLVYSGGNPPYGSDSPAVPVSIYGWSKLMADMMVLRNHPGALLLRTSVLCGETGSRRRTFSQDVLSGRLRRVWVDSWRNHTPLKWLAGVLPGLLDDGLSGLAVACGDTCRSRSAYAEALLARRGLPVEHLQQEYAPPGVPSALCLRGDLVTDDLELQ